MPFGSMQCPATFKRLMEQVFHDLSLHVCVLYVDNIFVPRETFDHHLYNLTEILQQLRNANLTLSLAKTTLPKTGLIPGACGRGNRNLYKYSKNKCNCILGSASGTLLLLQICPTVDLCNFAHIACPLHTLTQAQNAKFHWNEANNAFDKFKMHQSCGTQAQRRNLGWIQMLAVMDLECIGSGGARGTEVFRMVVRFEMSMRVYISREIETTRLMPLAFSVDLRWRAIWLYIVVQLPISEISRQLCIYGRTIRRYINMFEQTGDIQPRRLRHGPPMLLGDNEQLVLLRIISKNTGIYLSEIQGKLQLRFGVKVSAATICKTLKYMGCTRQVIQHVTLHHSNECRARFMAEVSVYDPTMLILIDESGCDKRNSIRKRAYDVRGITPKDHRLLIRGTRYSTIPIISTDGVHDVYLCEENVNGERLTDFVQHFLQGFIEPFNWINHHSVIIMDNASIHHVDEVVDLIENQLPARLIFLPPYSPDLNPAEEVFSKVKSIMKQNDSLLQACSNEEMRVFLTMAFGMVTKEDCNSYIAHSGYL